MRDDEGKMTKNAHLLGTLRRCLKLMYLRIKPVFVFDGQTPVLKLNTLKQRRTILEQNEGSMRKAAEKILMNKIKQEILSLKSLSASQNILPTFHPLDANPTEHTGCNHAPASGARVRVVDESGERHMGKVISLEGSVCRVRVSEGVLEVEYPSNSLELVEPCKICFPDLATTTVSKETISTSQQSKSKKSKGRTGRLHESESDNESLGSTDESETAGWALPTNGELDLETLASLPDYMRKDVIEASRREERVRKRGTYLMVASDPKLYSQTQISNFLRTRY